MSPKVWRKDKNLNSTKKDLKNYKLKVAGYDKLNTKINTSLSISHHQILLIPISKPQQSASSQPHQIIHLFQKSYTLPITSAPRAIPHPSLTIRTIRPSIPGTSPVVGIYDSTRPCCPTAPQQPGIPNYAGKWSRPTEGEVGRGSVLWAGAIYPLSSRFFFIP